MAKSSLINQLGKHRTGYIEKYSNVLANISVITQTSRSWLSGSTRISQALPEVQPQSSSLQKSRLAFCEIFGRGGKV